MKTSANPNPASMSINFCYGQHNNNGNSVHMM